MKKALHFIFFLSFIGSMTAQTPSNLWTPQGIGLLPAGHDVLSIAVVNKDIAWAATNLSIIGPIPGNNVSKILKTTNGGTTWQTYNLSAATGRAGLEIYAIDSLVAWITTASYAGLPNDLYKTTDGGNTWVLKTSGYEASLFIRFFDAENGIIWNRHRLAMTTNGGNTWTTSTVSGFASNENFGSASINNAWATVGDSIWGGTTLSRIAFSPDRGVTWQFQNLQSVPNFGTKVWIVSVAFKDARNGIAMGYNSNTTFVYLAKTTDAGATWSSISATYPFTNGSAIEYVRGTKGTYIIGDFGGLSAYTTNAGQSWIKIDDLEINCLRFLNAQTGWAGRATTTANGPVFYKWNGGSSLTDIKVIEPEELALKISPNPTSRYLTVSYSADFKPTELTLYDLAGKAIFYKKDPSVFSQVIDLEGLANGIYLLQLKNTEGVTAAHKVVIKR